MVAPRGPPGRPRLAELRPSCARGDRRPQHGGAPAVTDEAAPEKKSYDGWDNPGWKTEAKNYHAQRPHPAVSIAANDALDVDVWQHDSQALIDQLAKASDL